MAPMPANHKVSVAWQIVFSFISPLNLWAFYRIRKLRKYLLYIVAPSAAISLALVLYLNASTDPTTLNPANPWFPYSEEQIPFVVITYVASSALQGFAVYLVIIWSRQHNRQFDQPAVQSADRP